MTKDLDIVIDIQAQDADKIKKLFPPDGFYCPPSEVLKAEMVSRGQFNLIHHESGLKIDMMIRKKVCTHSKNSTDAKKSLFGKNLKRG